MPVGRLYLVITGFTPLPSSGLHVFPRCFYGDSFRVFLLYPFLSGMFTSEVCIFAESIFRVFTFGKVLVALGGRNHQFLSDILLVSYRGCARSRQGN